VPPPLLPNPWRNSRSRLQTRCRFFFGTAGFSFRSSSFSSPASRLITLRRSSLPEPLLAISVNSRQLIPLYPTRPFLQCDPKANFAQQHLSPSNPFPPIPPPTPSFPSRMGARFPLAPCTSEPSGESPRATVCCRESIADVFFP